jgi:TonB-linked SusC/RagA family outer membrane protein
MMSGSSYRSFSPTHDKLTETDGGEINSVTQSMSLTNRWSWDNTIGYKFKVCQDHAFDVMLGQSVERWGYGESMSATNHELSFGDLEHAYLTNATRNPVTSKPTGTPASEGAIASFFGRINYDYAEKYMLTVIMRGDGSSVFAPGNRWGFFPSVSAGWVISNEPFLKDNENVDMLKLRASWGQNGNCNVSGNQHIATITSNQGYGGYTFGDIMDAVSTGSYAYKVLNYDLKWETSEQLNVGMDAAFFDSRFKVELDWYRKVTKDWLVTAPVLMSWGANAPSINGGAVRNTGVELGLHWNDNVNNDFYYGVDFNLAYNNNKVTSIENSEGIIHGPSSVFWEGSDECFRAQVGEPIGFFYGYISDGIFQNQKQIDEYKGALLNGAKTAPGDVIWRDVDGNGTIDAGDRTKIGNPNPDFTMGLSFNLGWKGLDLGVTTYGAFGHQILKCYRDFSSSPLNNYTADIYNRWNGEGSSYEFPRLSSASNTNWNRISTLYMENGDYLKIKNVTLGCDFKKFFPKMPFGQLRVYVTAQNLFTFTKYSGMDPEIGYGDEYGWASGIDLGYYPSARTYMVGLNIKFN